MKSLFSEFKRRNVFRVAALYLVGAWLIAQVADVVIGLGELPPAVGRTVLIILALGFPVALVAAWVFEWTPQGIRRESEAAEELPTDRSSARRLDYVIISLLSVALVYFIVNHDWQGPPGVSSASIAVLPFENRSAQPDDLYFTDGIHEDILTQLGKISSMVVISRTSVMQYRDSAKTIPEIARELGVATILEGGVQRAGNRVRINLQLIDATADRHLWAETYDRELSAENVFAIQSEIATSIADALHARLLPQERARIAAAPTQNLEAYDAYLLGRRQLASRQLEDLVKAREFFERAIELDPEFALAYTGLADTLILISSWGEDGSGLLVDAEAAARKALDLSPNLGEAHTSFGVVKQFMGTSAEDFAPHLERGVELAPGSADARKWYASHLSESHRHDDALEQLEVAVRLDPMSPIVRVNLGSALESVGRNEEAFTHYVRALEIDPRFLPALFSVWEHSSTEEGLVVTSTAYKAQISNPQAVLQFVLGYLELGDDARAEQWVAELDRLAPGVMWGPIAHLNLSLYRSQQADALKYARQMVKYEQGVITVPTRTLLLDDLRRGDLAAAMERYAQKYPNLLTDDPTVTDNYPAAIDVAMLFQAVGETEKADRLLDRSLEYMATLPKKSARTYAIFKARVHAMRGRNEEALAALREAIDSGWKFQWWFYLKQDPALDPLRDDARFQAMVAEMSNRKAQQLAKVRQLEAQGEIALPPTE